MRKTKKVITVKHLYHNWPLYNILFPDDLTYAAASVQAVMYAAAHHKVQLKGAQVLELGAGATSIYARLLTAVGCPSVEMEEITNDGYDLLKPRAKGKQYPLVVGLNNLVNGLTNFEGFYPVLFTELVTFFENVRLLLGKKGIAVFERYNLSACRNEGVLAPETQSYELNIDAGSPLYEALKLTKEQTLSVTCRSRYDRTTRSYSRDFSCSTPDVKFNIKHPLTVTMWDESTLSEAAAMAGLRIEFITAGGEMTCGMPTATPEFLTDTSAQESTHIVVFN